MDDADNIIEAVPHHRKSRVSRFDRQRNQRIDGCGLVDRHHANSRNHGIVRGFPRQTDRPCQQLNLTRVERALLARRADYRLDLFAVANRFEFIGRFYPQRASQADGQPVEQRHNGSGQDAVHRRRPGEQ